MEGSSGPSVPVGTYIRWLIATWARSIEELIPISSERRERWREKRLLNKWIKGFLLFALGGGTMLALVCAYQLTVERADPAAIQAAANMEVLGGIVAHHPAAIRVARSGNLLLGANATPSAMHGPLAVKPGGGQWGYENSLRFPLDRAVEDHRSRQCKAGDYSKDRLPKTSVIIIFCNEPFETLMRSVHSVLNRSPPNLLEEIILVDDGSTADHIKPLEFGGSGLVEEHLKRLPPKIQFLRTGRRSGIVNARLTGIRAAKGEAFVILDSHIECQPGWLEALVKPIGADRTAVVMPQIDGIDKFSFTPQKGGVGCTLGIIWKIMEHAFHPDSYSPKDRREAKPWDYVTSPTMAGGLFAANKEFFLEIGGYDEAMTGWGAENVELSFRLWQCGGKLLCTECSRVYHMFGGGKHYTVTGHSTTSNRMRTMAAWMDEYADLAWHVLGRPSLSEIGDISPQLKLRETLKCHDFKWFLDKVWPESEVRSLTEDIPFMGPLRNVGAVQCLSAIHRGSKRFAMQSCNNPGSFIYWRREGRITSETNDETCLLTTGQADWCHYPQSRRWEIENKSEAYADLKMKLEAESRPPLCPGSETILARVIDPNSGKCLTAVLTQKGKYQAELATCDNRKQDEFQLWIWCQYRPDPVWKNLHN